MYRIADYGKMIADAHRIGAYANALKRAVFPGAVVIDIGTGSGIFSLLACQSGAARVYAIDKSDSIHVAKEIVAANGFSDRVIFKRGRSSDISLPEKADVIVSDLRGVLPLYKDHLPSIRDACRRMLKPGGVLIPERDFMCAGIVAAGREYNDNIQPWEKNTTQFDLTALTRLSVNAWYKAHFRENQLLLPPKQWAVLNYSNLEGFGANGQVAWRVRKKSTAHGIAVWFDTEFLGGTGYSNAPGGPDLIYGNAFFPFSKPVRLRPGDAVVIRLRADLIGGEYLWQWKTRIDNADDTKRERIHFDQSTFHGLPLSKNSLHQQRGKYLPKRTSDADVDLHILKKMDGRHSGQAIARHLMDRFPENFPSLEDAVNRVDALCFRYDL